MLLAIMFFILVNLFSFDNILNQTYKVYVIIIAIAESVENLNILVAFYRFHFFFVLFYLFYGKKTYYLSCIYVLPIQGVNFYKRIVTSYLTNYFKKYSTYYYKNYLLDP